MDQRISLVTLGISDLSKARAFYEALGWSGGPPDGEVVFFQAGGMIVALWERDKLAADSAVQDGGGWGGVTLAYNVSSPAEVDEVLAQAQAAGARIGRPGAPTARGGYSGVFIDPDGHPWEVAHNPDWILEPGGEVRRLKTIDSAAARPARARKADTLDKLGRRHADIWVATSAGAGAHLVPLSYAWAGERVLLVTEAASATVRNLSATRTARLALGPTRDVVVIEATVEKITRYQEAPAELIDAYLAQADWDPSQVGGQFVMVVLRPDRLQAWREANEIAGRTLMRDGAWVV